MNTEEKILSILETLMTKVDNLEQEVQAVKITTLRIENEHGKKLDALFDGYGQLYDISKEIRKDIAVLQGSQEKQELHIKWLDSHQKA